MTELKPAVVAAPGAILVVPFADGIGDFINMQPLLEAVARRFPGATVSVAASGYAHYLKSPSNPVEIVTPSWFEKEPGPVAQTLRHFIPQSVLARIIGPALKREMDHEIDLVINTVLLWEKRMDFPRYWTPQLPPRPGAVHTLDCLADAIEEELGIVIPVEERYPKLEVRESARLWAEQYIQAHALEGEQVIAMIPESNMLIKKWPAASWAFLNDQFQQRGYKTLFFGPENSELISRVAAISRHPVQRVSTTLDNVAGLMERVNLAIGVDTGLLHIASAVGTPWLGIFGPTNPDVTGPYDRRIGRGLVAPFPRGESCRTCWKSFKYEDDKCHTLLQGACTDFLDRRRVLEAALEMLPMPLTAGGFPA
ncbi:MAG TPA: glycosyltransferase family 9 protein [Chloroflexia bacterium]|nr:glycosyltransferase family 9 protein [Chloroflexia bacterium]